MASWSILLRIYFLRFARFLIDLASNFVFWLIYLKRSERVGAVRNPLLLQPVRSLAEWIRNGEVKSVDIIEAYIERIKEVQPIINAVTENRFQDALEDARKADELIQSRKYTREELKKLYPYLGIPMSVKEPIGVKGMLNTAGTFKNKGNRASEDSETVMLMRKAGAIPLVTTNIPEICMWWESSNNIYGQTCNPYETRRFPGGSSGGEGALIAAGGSLIGIASDLGGSIRMPAFFNGIFGHKPSKGIVSNEGQIPGCDIYLDEFAVTGPMCRYAEDLLPMFKVLAGRNASKLKLDEVVKINRLKVYYMEENNCAFCTPVHPEIKAAMRKVVKHFEEVHGIESKEVHFTEMRESCPIWIYNLASLPGPNLEVHLVGEDQSLNEIREIFKWLMGSSKFTLPCILFSVSDKRAKSNIKAQNRYKEMAVKLKNDMEELLGDDGIFLYPPHPETAIYHNQGILKFSNVAYTSIFNILGLPVTQCPLGLSSRGLPLGVQVVAGLGKDHLTLAAAVELEKAFGGWKNPNL